MDKVQVEGERFDKTNLPIKIYGVLNPTVFNMEEYSYTPSCTVPQGGSFAVGFIQFISTFMRVDQLDQPQMNTGIEAWIAMPDNAFYIYKVAAAE